jgi:membrane protein implicated in regulation of membrane protease activity
MKFLKLALIGIVVVFLLFIGLRLISVAIRVMFFLFWLALIGFAAVMLWKMFGSNGSGRMEEADERDKLQNAELTLEEYKRKLEDDLRKSSER